MAKLSFIGAGNVAWHLAQALEDAGHSIRQVYSRDIRHAKELTRNLYDAQAVNTLDFTDSDADIFFITIPDDAVERIADSCILPESAILCHTSGTLPLVTLRPFPDRGVFYPLQTFSKSRHVDVQKVPFCLEASNDRTEEFIVALAQSISKTVYLVSSDERKILHIGAVFACNFSNHLMAIARDIVEREGLEFSLLKPLIEETFTKALAVDNPATVQTGPAIRGDEQTISNHVRYLKDQPLQQRIYKLLTESIQDMGKG
ncbi:DUF2520 domain-containing protein [Cytophagaceae bacterium YF14B1]|uniref:DUF2520 domain-containing protein n=1 Tax=Xanthocytophaga flava TaxID=3048013 RepID=A0AAE3U8C2_9BACT|nr:Rossmann-like and DUF2520 domain-containing protein [Xanthocytophaga flavus]MDJ1483271.1 DUF2520 domain-containing protein [Xanthocytophaga flavus]